MDLVVINCGRFCSDLLNDKCCMIPLMLSMRLGFGLPQASHFGTCFIYLFNDSQLLHFDLIAFHE